MGCDIHMFGEKRVNNGYTAFEFKETVLHRDYNLFAFLANVRNSSLIGPTKPRVTPLDKPRGKPKDISPIINSIHANQHEVFHVHSTSWFTTGELLAVDYDAPMVNHDGVTLRQFLIDDYFIFLETLKENHIDRVVFWFDG